MNNVLKRTTLIDRDAECPHAFEVRGADGHLVRMTSLSFWDPDGYFFEVDQRSAA